MIKILIVEPHSRAEKAGIRAGDYLVSVNRHVIRDVLDYRFYIAETRLDVEVRRDKTPMVFRIHKQEYDDIGLAFETPLMDKKLRCTNACIFCFIDQLPKGLRESLYFKDDDSRLSFLHGNYITMTNMTEEDIRRIIEMHISPVNISIHTMNPELRVKMMHNRHAGEVLRYLDMFMAGGIKMHAQIVLCKGINDGKELDDTMRRLVAYHPNLESVSVVTAGLTSYRRGLYPLEPFDEEDCAALIEQVTGFGDQCFEKFGNRLFYCSDEIYIKGKVPIPGFDFWGEFDQIENGVGMLSSFEYEFSSALAALSEEERSITREVSIATGECSSEFIRSLTAKAEMIVPGLKVYVYTIINRFFGGNVTVTGLLTGLDLMDQLKGKNLGNELLLSRSMLRAEGDLFLCGTSLNELKNRLQIPIRIVDNSGDVFLDALLGE